MLRIASISLAFLIPSAAVLAGGEVAKIKINGNDQMKYDVEKFEVKAGQKVMLTLKNVGKLPKVAMGHNFVLLKAGTDVTAFAMEAMKFATNEYIPDKKKGAIIAHTKQLGPGESDTIEFTAPPPGKYDYICTFPGHFALMKGVMTVK
jgi:azurin